MAEATRPLNLDPEFLAESRASLLQGAAIFFGITTSAMLLLRFFAKIRFQAPGIELFDIFLIAAYIITLGLCALGITMTIVGGVGRHVALFEQPGGDKIKLRRWAQCILAFEIIYFTSVAMPKIAVIFMYIRVFNWRDTMRRLAWALIAINASLAISLVVTACLQCIPIAYWWDRTIPGGRCLEIQTFFHAQAIPGFVLDLFIMVLPLKSIWDLKLPPLKKIALALIFLVASFGIVASIIRATVFFRTSALQDRTWASVDLVGWSIVESGTYVVTACLPHMKPIISHYTPQGIRELSRRMFSRASSALSGGHKSFSNGTTSKRSRRRPGVDLESHQGSSADDINDTPPVRLASLDRPRPERHDKTNCYDNNKYKSNFSSNYNNTNNKNNKRSNSNNKTSDYYYDSGDCGDDAGGRKFLERMPDPRSQARGASASAAAAAAAARYKTRSASAARPMDVMVTTEVTVTHDYDTDRMLGSNERSHDSWPIQRI